MRSKAVTCSMPLSNCWSLLSFVTFSASPFYAGITLIIPIMDFLLKVSSNQVGYNGSNIVYMRIMINFETSFCRKRFTSCGFNYFPSTPGLGSKRLHNYKSSSQVCHFLQNYCFHHCILDYLCCSFLLRTTCKFQRLFRSNTFLQEMMICGCCEKWIQTSCL